MFNRREVMKHCGKGGVFMWAILEPTLRHARGQDGRRPDPASWEDVYRTLPAQLEPERRTVAANYISTYGKEWLRADAKMLQKSTESYARYTSRALGLDERDEWDEELIAAIASTPRCDCPDSQVQNAAVPGRWPSLGTDPVNWWLEAAPTAWAREAWAASCRAAFDSWSAVCGINFQQVNTKSDAQLIVSIGRGRALGFDGPSGVLAWAQLPPSNRFKGQLLTRFDDQEPWIPVDGRAGIIAQAVQAHEFGHLMGLDHSSNRNDLMAPFYSARIICPQSGDIKRAVTLYEGRTGPVDPPKPPPPKPPEPPPADGPCGIAPPVGGVKPAQQKIGELPKRMEERLK